MFKSSTGGGTAFASIETKLYGGSPDDPGLPVTMRKAVRFMLLGAAITGVFALFEVVVTIVDKNSIDINGKPPTSSQLATGIVILIVSYAVYILLWILMARFNRAGQKWARIVSSVLFAIATYDLYRGVNSLQGGQTILVLNIISFALAIAEWICGLGAVALLWRSESSIYFNERTAQR